MNAKVMMKLLKFNPTIDLLTIRKTKLARQYCTLSIDPKATARDAFTIPQKMEKPVIHPSISLIDITLNLSPSSQVLINGPRALTRVNAKTVICNNATSTSIKELRLNTAKEILDRDTYNIDDLLNYIRCRVQFIKQMDEEKLEGITLALIMAITARRMAELTKAAHLEASFTSDQFEFQSDIIKISGDRLSLIVRRAKDPTVCSVCWFTHWWMIQMQRSKNGQILRQDQKKNKPASADKCLLLTKMVINAAGLLSQF
ncbi:MAG: hypothetical protein EZS28_003905 [Streblomastix strix]|uniref:Uncharacterized protein n=1 Tax=Streblomastix strix TaxID=222440 RepID=A0A5J4WZM1_9EUKA|nr:MAG: hypothetical protein EZS28_003905 [Streblomastix strix]